MYMIVDSPTPSYIEGTEPYLTLVVFNLVCSPKHLIPASLRKPQQKHLATG